MTSWLDNDKERNTSFDFSSGSWSPSLKMADEGHNNSSISETSEEIGQNKFIIILKPLSAFENLISAI